MSFWAAFALALAFAFATFFAGLATFLVAGLGAAGGGTTVTDIDADLVVVPAVLVAVST